MYDLYEVGPVVPFQFGRRLKVHYFRRSEKERETNKGFSSSLFA